MPTKRNRAGKQQNYIEAGHGDASGEYGDNATGSNKHFTVFQKPKETRSKELTSKQIQEIGNYVLARKDLLKSDSNYYKRLINNLRYYNGSFGDLSGFSDDDLKDIIEELNNLPISDDYVNYKKGSKWMMTKNVGLLDRLGIEHFTKEEKEEQIRQVNVKTIEKSQTPQDKNIQKTLGGNSVVCFGKGYSKDDLDQIETDTQTYINDFPELKDTIKGMGDRNNLEKYINAIRENSTPSEEEIAREMKRIKKYSLYERSEEELRKRAIETLTGKISIQRANNAYAYWSPSEHFMVYMGKMKKVTEEEKASQYRSNFKSSNKKNSTFCHEMGHAVDTAMEEFYKKQVENLENQLPSYEDDSIMTREQVMAKRNEINPKILQLERTRDKFQQDLYNLRSQNINKDYETQFRNEFKETFDVYPDDMNLDYLTREQYKAQIEKKLFNDGIKKYNISKYGASNKDEFVAECFSAHYTGMNNPLATQVVELFKNYANELRSVK